MAVVGHDFLQGFFANAQFYHDIDLRGQCCVLGTGYPAYLFAFHLPSRPAATTVGEPWTTGAYGVRLTEESQGK